jgi:hypothetical protein
MSQFLFLPLKSSKKYYLHILITRKWKSILSLDLQELVIKNAFTYGIPTFDSIGHFALDSQIKKFDLSVFNFNPYLQQKHLTRIFSVCSQLEELVLDGCYSMDDVMMTTLSNSPIAAKLIKISLAFCYKLTDKSAKILLFSSSFKKLEEVVLDGCNSMEGKWQSGEKITLAKIT